LGIDETSWLAANRHHATFYATGLSISTPGILIDLVEGNSATDLREWPSERDPGGWRGSGW
jgi:hypothetical protein